jgi:hypothetical protein
MEMDRIRAALHAARQMRTPRFEPDTPPSTKIGRLEDYLLESAWMQGELEDALFWLDALTVHFETQVRDISGWEVALPNKRRERITQADVEQAKRTVDPIAFDASSEVRQVRGHVLRQIDRLRWEAGQGPVSRAYTLIVGG